MQKPFHPPATVDMTSLFVAARKLRSKARVKHPVAPGWHYAVGRETYEQFVEAFHSGRLGDVIVDHSRTPSEPLLFGIPLRHSSEVGEGRIVLSYAEGESFEVTL